MLLYSGRNVVVHPCKSFLTGSPVGCGVSDKFKNAFFHKILMRDLEVFSLVCVSRLTDYNEICQNEEDGGLLMLTKFGLAVLVFGDIRPQNMYKNNRFRSVGRHDSCINVTFGTAEGTKDPACRAKFHVPRGYFGISNPKTWKIAIDEQTPGRWCIAFEMMDMCF